MEQPGLVTITGGKWTTYRNMAEVCVDQVASLAGLPQRACPTRELRIHGFDPEASSIGDLAVYGSDAMEIKKLIQADPTLAAPLHPALTYLRAEVVWATRMEMARTVADVLARRTRALFLNARAALEMAPQVAGLMGKELGKSNEWKETQVKEFARLTEGFFA